jgi:hypothetical protein
MKNKNSKLALEILCRYLKIIRAQHLYWVINGVKTKKLPQIKKNLLFISDSMTLSLKNKLWNV